MKNVVKFDITTLAMPVIIYVISAIKYQKKTTATFHNAFNFDYHFITKKLPE